MTPVTNGFSAKRGSSWASASTTGDCCWMVTSHMESSRVQIEGPTPNAATWCWWVSSMRLMTAVGTPHTRAASSTRASSSGSGGRPMTSYSSSAAARTASTAVASDRGGDRLSMALAILPEWRRLRADIRAITRLAEVTSADGDHSGQAWAEKELRTVLKDLRVHTTLPATDIARAKEFYRDKLGLEPEEETPGGLRYACGGSEFV